MVGVAALVRPFIIGTGQPLGISSPTFADEIVYYRMALGTDQVTGRFGLYYDPGSGKVARSTTTDVQAFARLANQGKAKADKPLNAAKEQAPNIRAIMPCHVVVHLVSPDNWYFLPTFSGIRTAADCSPKYKNLNHVLKDNSVVPGDLPGPYGGDPGNAMCKVMYFSIPSPTLTGDAPDDLFGFYTQLDNGNGTYVPLLVDPDIKNNGGDQDP